MARYIDANKLQEDFEKIADEPDYMHEGETWQTGIYLAGTITDKQPTADVEEVRHGEWESKPIKAKGYDSKTSPTCSICGYQNFIKYDYCPECGAKMDGGKNE